MYKSVVSFIKEGEQEPILNIPGDNIHIPRTNEYIIIHDKGYEVYYITHVFTKSEDDEKDYMVAYVYLKELKK